MQGAMFMGVRKALRMLVNAWDTQQELEQSERNKQRMGDEAGGRCSRR